MSASTPKPKPTVPVALSFEAIDDLIYDARAGDLEALKADIAALASQHSCPESHIVASAIDMEDESEGGTGSCVLHFPAANGNIGTLYLVFFYFLLYGSLSNISANLSKKSSTLFFKNSLTWMLPSVRRSSTTATTLATRRCTGLR
jgi:hypothetical protein